VKRRLIIVCQTLRPCEILHLFSQNKFNYCRAETIYLNCYTPRVVSNSNPTQFVKRGRSAPDLFELKARLLPHRHFPMKHPPVCLISMTIALSSGARHCFVRVPPHYSPRTSARPLCNLTPM